MLFLTERRGGASSNLGTRNYRVLHLATYGLGLYAWFVKPGNSSASVCNILWYHVMEQCIDFFWILRLKRWFGQDISNLAEKSQLRCRQSYHRYFSAGWLDTAGSSLKCYFNTLTLKKNGQNNSVTNMRPKWRHWCWASSIQSCGMTLNSAWRSRFTTVGHACGDSVWSCILNRSRDHERLRGSTNYMYITMGLVRITSWYPNFNGGHFGLPPNEIHRMTGLPPKIVWTMTYSHRPHIYLMSTSGVSVWPPCHSILTFITEF